MRANEAFRCGRSLDVAIGVRFARHVDDRAAELVVWHHAVGRPRPFVGVRAPRYRPVPDYPRDHRGSRESNDRQSVPGFARRQYAELWPRLQRKSGSAAPEMVGMARRHLTRT